MTNLYILKELVRFGFFIEFFNETEALVKFRIHDQISKARWLGSLFFALTINDHRDSVLKDAVMDRIYHEIP